MRRKILLARAGGSQGKRAARGQRNGALGIGGSQHCGHQVHPPGEKEDLIGLLGGRHVGHGPSLRPRPRRMTSWTPPPAPSKWRPTSRGLLFLLSPSGLRAQLGDENSKFCVDDLPTVAIWSK